jgi:hypothetical protein
MSYSRRICFAKLNAPLACEFFRQRDFLLFNRAASSVYPRSASFV